MKKKRVKGVEHDGFKVCLFAGEGVRKLLGVGAFDSSLVFI